MTLTHKTIKNLGKKTKKNETNNKTKTNKRKVKHVYNKEEYNSGDGMLTTVWGPSVWHFLHTMSFNYPTNPTQEQKEQYRNFVLSLQHVLPCKYCRINLVTNFKQMPLTMGHMKNRETHRERSTVHAGTSHHSDQRALEPTTLQRNNYKTYKKQ
jgi:hypothetical protein